MVDESRILQVLAEQKEENALLKPRHWVKRMEESLFEFDSPLAQVVVGVRRSGKSTLCHKVLKERSVRYGYANLDDDRLADMRVEDLNTLLSCLYQLYGTDVSYLFFDEIQNVDGWHLFVNRLLRNGLHIFVTGSNAKLLSSELATYLTGRYNEIHLYPFSFSEFCAFHNIDTKGITTKADAECKRAFVDYLNTGGFPEMQSMHNKRGYVQSLLGAILQKDIRQRFGIYHIDALEKIAYNLISNACQVVNYNDLATTLGLSDKTVKKYVGYLQQAFLVQLLPRHSFKSKERLVGEKAYLVDNGLENNRYFSMAGENTGWRLENAVYIELLRRCSKAYFDVYYYRPDSRSKEVDFVVCNQNRAVEMVQVAFEIDKPKTFARETSSLVKASALLRCDKLTLVAFSPSRTEVVDGKEIKIVSVTDWFLKSEDIYGEL